MAGYRFFLDGTEYDEPIGFDAIQFTAMRLEWHGIDQPFTTDVVFDGKAALYLKSQFDAKFINADVSIVITSDVKDGATKWEFNGKINFATYEETNACDTDGFSVKVLFIEDDFRELFKSRQDVELDLTTNTDLDGNAIDPITFRNTRLHTQQLYLFAKARNYSTQTAQLFYDPGEGWRLEDFADMVPAYYANSDFKEVFGNTFNPTGPNYTNTNATFVNNSDFARTVNFDIVMSGDFRQLDLETGETCNVSLSIQVLNSSGTETQRFYLGDSANSTGGSPAIIDYAFSGSQDITLQPGDRVLIFLQWGSGGTVKPGTTPDPNDQRRLGYRIEEFCMNVTEKNAAAFGSIVESLSVEEYLRRLIYVITGDSDGLISDTFSESDDGCYWNNVMTNGLRIRNAETIEQITGGCVDVDARPLSFKATWKKAFESLDRIFCLGWAFEQNQSGQWKIRVEGRDYFYQSTIGFEARNVAEIKQVPAIDALVNNIIIGFSDKWKNISISGQWAIHTERSYFIGNRAISEDSSTKRLDLRSEFICEGNSIEFSRRLQFIKNDSGSSDRPNDNETFLIWVNRFDLNVPDIESSPFGLPGETGEFDFSPGTVSLPSDYITESNAPIRNLYNIYHTPARIACRWWKVVGSYTYGLTDPRLRYQFGEYFVGYSSRITGEDEKESCIEPFQGEYAALEETTDIYPDLLNEEFQTYLFKPIEARFDYPQDLCSFLELANKNQYGRVLVTNGSLEFTGYIQEIANEPNANNGGTTSFLLMGSNIPVTLGDYNNDFNDDYNNGN